MRDRTTRGTAAVAATSARGTGETLDPLGHLDNVEQQSTGGDAGLDQLDREPVAQPVGLAGTLADQELAAFVVAIELLADVADRDQTVRSRTIDGDEQAEARDRADARAERRADMGRHEVRDVAVHGVAFGRDSAALAHREMLAELDEARRVAARQAAVSQTEGRDQRAVHEQIGIAPDR